MQTDFKTFEAARQFLLNVKTYEEAVAGFHWPRLTRFNWAIDHFDRIARGNAHDALIFLDEAGHETRLSFEELRRRSNRAANFFRDQGLRHGDVALVMLRNSVELFEVLLGAMKASIVLCPASLLLTPADLADRIRRGRIKAVVADASCIEKVREADVLSGFKGVRVVVGEAAPGWTPFSQARSYPEEFLPQHPTLAADLCLLYFTSGTTAEPKLVAHTHESYPVGHLVTMYWVGMRTRDIHYNISAPGWAKHAWSSFFAPWNAGATIFTYDYQRFHASAVLDAIEKYQVTTLCAPPTVWRMFLLEDLRSRRFSLRELVSAGEPLNPEVIRRVHESTGLWIREGYGQTETVLQTGVFPGMPIKPGKMGKPSPGFDVLALDSALLPAKQGSEGQLAVRVAPERPTGMMKGYLDDPVRMGEVFTGDWYLTGDMGFIDEDGYISFIGRNDDVFKSSDYRISPFEIESLLLRHRAVAEAGVVGSMDAGRGGLVPKAFVKLKPGFAPDRALALDIFRFSRNEIAPYKRIRRLEFVPELVKTVSGKIRRSELRAYDQRLRGSNSRGELEFMESEFTAELAQPAGG